MRFFAWIVVGSFVASGLGMAFAGGLAAFAPEFTTKVVKGMDFPTDDDRRPVVAVALGAIIGLGVGVPVASFSMLLTVLHTLAKNSAPPVTERTPV